MISSKVLLISFSVIAMLVTIGVYLGVLNDESEFLSAQFEWDIGTDRNATYLVQGQIHPSTLQGLRFEIHEQSEDSLDDWLYVVDSGRLRVWWRQNNLLNETWHLVSDNQNLNIPLELNETTSTQTSLSNYNPQTKELFITGFDEPLRLISLTSEPIDVWTEPFGPYVVEDMPEVLSRRRFLVESSSEYLGLINDMDDSYYADRHSVENSITKENAYCFYEDIDASTCRITFRGSDDGTDWASNVDVSLSTQLAPFSLHNGFVKEFNRILSVMDGNDVKFDKFLLRCGTKKLQLVGHSLGGAIADVASLWISQNYPSIDYELFTAGQPRALSTDSLSSLSPAERSKEKYRVAADGDLVTGLPYAWMGYAHMPYGCVYHCYFYLTIRGWEEKCKTYRAEDKKHENFGYLKPWNHRLAEYIKFTEAYQNAEGGC